MSVTTRHGQLTCFLLLSDGSSISAILAKATSAPCTLTESSDGICLIYRFSWSVHRRGGFPYLALNRIIEVVGPTHT